jgi:hypothetical protein
MQKNGEKQTRIFLPRLKKYPAIKKEPYSPARKTSAAKAFHVMTAISI